MKPWTFWSLEVDAKAMQHSESKVCQTAEAATEVAATL
jgi:hypothetical protein